MHPCSDHHDKSGILIRAVLVLALLMAAVAVPAAYWQAPAAAPQIAQAPGGLNAGEWASLGEQMAAAQYQFTWQEWEGAWAYRAPNHSQGLDLALGLEGLTATRYAQGQPAWRFGLSLLAYGDSPMPSLGREQLTAQTTRVEYRWDERVTEWYENKPEGLEHGLTLAAPPAQGEAVLTFALRGDLRAKLDAGGGGLRLVDGAGRTALRYDALKVVDAAGRELLAQMEVGGKGEHTGSPLRILIEAQGARYPITVDPLIYSQTTILRASDRQAGDLFGHSVAIDGDTIVIGAKDEDGGAGDPVSNAGAAYVLTRNQGGADLWGEATILRASDQQIWDAFGFSVAIAGDTIVVGAPEEDGGAGDPTSKAGAAYVFSRNHCGADAWGQVAILHASDLQADDLFGWSVAISGDTIVVGAFYEDGGAGDPVTDAGAAYVYSRNQGGADAWGQVAILRASDRQVNDFYGRSVAISDDTLVVGADQEDGGVGDPLMHTGAAYVYTRNQGGANQWGELTILRASDSQQLDFFGRSVSISGDTIVVGAPGEAGGAGDPLPWAGAAYVFSRNQGGADAWGEAAILRASDRQMDDDFGVSVAISGDTIVVGAHWEDGGAGDPLNNAGAAYVFSRNHSGADGWGDIATLRATDRQAGDNFGLSVAISGNTIVVGAYQEDGGAGDPLPEAGAAYIFNAAAGRWSEIAIPCASDRQASDVFGQSIALDGDTLVVGAYNEGGGAGDPLPGSGAVYVFRRNQGGADAWGQAVILRASDRQSGDNFGISVAISGDTIVVGANSEDGGAGNPVSESGAAYVFYRNQGGADAWGEAAILRASDAQYADIFGFSVAISGDTILVGAPYEDGGAGDLLTNAGAAYIFSRNQGGVDAWGEVTILRASDQQGYDVFGFSVAIDGDTLIVGAYGEDGGAGNPVSGAGAAYIYSRNQGGAEAWGEVTILRASDLQTDDFFGYSVALHGDLLVVGAPREDGGAGNPASNAGAAYVFSRNQGGPDAWGEAAILHASDWQSEDWFGISAAINGDTLVVGAYQEDGGAGNPLSDAGAAYIFRRNQGGADAWGEVTPLLASDRQSGDNFGYAVAISGNWIVVGAPYEDGGAGNPASGAGSAYLFEWLPYQVMLPLLSHQ